MINGIFYGWFIIIRNHENSSDFNMPVMVFCIILKNASVLKQIPPSSVQSVSSYLLFYDKDLFIISVKNASVVRKVKESLKVNDKKLNL